MTRESDDKIGLKAWLGYAVLFFVVMVAAEASGCESWLGQAAEGVGVRIIRFLSSDESSNTFAAGGSRGDIERLRAARTLRCSFEGFSTDFVFDSIDYAAGTARMVGNAGSASLGAIMGANGATFVEITSTGNIMTTTVFAWWDTDRRYVAVHSRHTAIAGDPVPSQVHGACSALL